MRLFWAICKSSVSQTTNRIEEIFQELATHKINVDFLKKNSKQKINMGLCLYIFAKDTK